jgi:hypothetical protein
VKNDPLDINPPAIVRQAETPDAELVGKIKDAWKRFQTAGRSMCTEGETIGEWLEAWKKRNPGKLKAFVAEYLPFSYRWAKKLCHTARQAIADRENPEELSSPERLERNLKILNEDIPEKEVEPTAPPAPGSVDAALAPAGEGPPREPGDMTPEEAEQDRIETALKAAIKKALDKCKRCSRIGVASCKSCKARVYDLMHPTETPDTSKPKKPKNTSGQALFLWPQYHKVFGETVRAVDTICNGYGIPRVNSEAEALRTEIRAWNIRFKAWTAKVTKQKPPEA